MGRLSTAKTPEPQNAASKLGQRCLSIIELAKEPGNAAEACRQSTRTTGRRPRRRCRRGSRRWRTRPRGQPTRGEACAGGRPGLVDHDPDDPA